MCSRLPLEFYWFLVMLLWNILDKGMRASPKGSEGMRSIPRGIEGMKNGRLGVQSEGRQDAECPFPPQKDPGSKGSK
jgi:hypothetical protein